MKQIRFDLETITPMFICGENQQKVELRPPSIKGLMRFWWRAYYWGKKTEDISSEAMLKKEGEIFGIASGTDKKSRKSGFSIRIIPGNIESKFEPFPKRQVKTTNKGSSPNIDILEYLAYGAYSKKEKKNYLPVNSSFAVILNISDDATQNGYAHDIVMSFYWLSFLGGIGAKSRNGFGNFGVKKIQVSETDLIGDIKFTFPSKEFISEKILNPHIPPFTAFSKNMKIFKLQRTCASWDECLGELGEIYRESKGELDKPRQCEKRQYITAPITIQSRVGGRWRTHDRSFLERRSKPYFMRLIKTLKGFDGYIIYIPSSYCEGMEKDRNNNKIYHKEVNAQFTGACEEFNSSLARRMEKII